MNNKTKSYFATLLVAVLIFSGAKYIVNNINKTKKVNPPVEIKEQKQETIKKTEPVIKEFKPMINKKGLETGGNWRSR